MIPSAVRVQLQEKGFRVRIPTGKQRELLQNDDQSWLMFDDQGKRVDGEQGKGAREGMGGAEDYSKIEGFEVPSDSEFMFLKVKGEAEPGGHGVHPLTLASLITNTVSSAFSSVASTAVATLGAAASTITNTIIGGAGTLKNTLETITKHSGHFLFS